MKKQDAMKWIDALRSGKYKQTTGILKNDEGYCCLGVLCELYPELALNKDALDVPNPGTLPSYEKIGLGGSHGNLNDTYFCLTDLNDAGYTFDEIADIIQIEYVEGL